MFFPPMHGYLFIFTLMFLFVFIFVSVLSVSIVFHMLCMYMCGPVCMSKGVFVSCICLEGQDD